MAEDRPRRRALGGVRHAVGRRLPDAVIDEIRLIRLRRRWPDAAISSSDVAPTAQLGRRVGIGKLAVVGEGVVLGDYTYLNRGAVIVSGTVGAFCSIGYFAQIGMEEHPVDHLSTSSWIYSGHSIVSGANSPFDEFSLPTVIGSDVWIGSGAIVVQGVTIGHGAIVAAGAVVTKDVEPFAVVAGVPARPVKKRFSDEAIAHVLRSPWWELPPERLDELAPMIAAGNRWVDLI